jgi:hypothetical protein
MSEICPGPPGTKRMSACGQSAKVRAGSSRRPPESVTHQDFSRRDAGSIPRSAPALRKARSDRAGSSADRAASQLAWSTFHRPESANPVSALSLGQCMTAWLWRLEGAIESFHSPWKSARWMARRCISRCHGARRRRHLPSLAPAAGNAAAPNRTPAVRHSPCRSLCPDLSLAGRIIRTLSCDRYIVNMALAQASR